MNNSIFTSFKIDFWTIWGMIAQGLFFSRFILQWYKSEKIKKVVIPIIFWYLSLGGALMVFVYALARSDIVFFIASILQVLLYSRSLILSYKNFDSTIL